MLSTSSILSGDRLFTLEKEYQLMTECLFNVGFNKMDITPFIGCNLPGLFEKRTMQGIFLIPPYVRSAVINNGDETVAIISVDILYVYWQSYTKILKRISDNTGIKPENILVCATHSHSGGPADYGIKCEEDNL